jgi:NADP-dependent aldehyde dehydrogenase
MQPLTLVRNNVNIPGPALSRGNSVFLLPCALASRHAMIAADFVAALTPGVGHFPTRPGIVVGLLGRDFEHFCDAAAAALCRRPDSVLASPLLAASYQRGLKRLRTHPEVLQLDAAEPGFDAIPEWPALALVPARRPPPAPGSIRPVLFVTSATAFLADPALSEVVFGPLSLLVACRGMAQMGDVAATLNRHRTATLHMDDGDREQAAPLLALLERKSARILMNLFPIA